MILGDNWTIMGDNTLTSVCKPDILYHIDNIIRLFLEMMCILKGYSNKVHREDNIKSAAQGNAGMHLALNSPYGLHSIWSVADIRKGLFRARMHLGCAM